MDEPSAARDPSATFLAWGVGMVLALAPLPFGAVRPWGRLAFECAAFAVGCAWLVRAWRRPVPLPPAIAAVGLVGLLAVAAIQALPMGASIVGLVSPAAASAAARFVPDAAARAAEAELLGEDPARRDRPASLSVDPLATASALRTGAALVFLLLAAAAVARAAGPEALALPLVLGAAFQALYGLAVLATGDASIWGEPKAAYLDAATGTFVNKNHFAIYVAAGSAAGFGLALGALARALEPRARHGAARLLERDGVVAALVALVTLLAMSGLLLSLSRAGILLGAVASGVVFLVGGRGLIPRVARVGALAVLFVIAAVPLARFGTEALAARYGQSVDDLSNPGTRPDVWADAVRIAASYPVAGAGFGTFAAIHPSYRSPEVRQRYGHAHNDLVQLAAEGGALGLVLFGLLAVPVGRAVRQALAGGHGPVWTGLAAGLAAIAAHALIDFPFHIPAVAAVGAALAGAMLGAPWSDPD